MMTMKLKLKQNLRSHGSRLEFNREKLKDQEVAYLFEATIGGKFAAINLPEANTDNLTENVHGALLDNASAVLDHDEEEDLDDQ